MGLVHASGAGVGPRHSTLFLYLLIGGISFGCFKQPLEPIAPSWDANFSLPLVNRLYTLSEIVQKDTSLLHVGTGGQIIYATSAQANPTYIGDLISVALRDTSLRVKFGSFKIDPPPVDIPIELPWLSQGLTVPIPDTTFAVPDLRDTIATFQRVTFERGSILLTLQNNLPIPVQVVNPLILLDHIGNVVATFIFSPSTIAPNSSQTASDNLADRTLDNIVRITGVSLHLLGSPSPVTIPSGTLFSAHLATSNLKARQAVFASIPPQRLGDNDTTHISVDDSTLIKELHIRTGGLHLTFTSHIGLDMVFKYRLMELLMPNGNSYAAFEDSLFLPANGSGSKDVSLADAKMRSQNQDLLRSLQVISSVILPTGSTQPVTVNDTDRVILNVTRTAPLVADSAVGVLKPTLVKINTIVHIGFGDLPTRFSGQLTVPAAALSLNTTSTINFPMDLNIRVGARKNSAGDSAFVTMPVSQKRVQTGSDIILFDQEEVGSFLSQFSGRLPNDLHIEGTALVNPPDTYNPTLAGVGAVGRNCSLSGRADLQIPLMLGIASGTFMDTLALGDTTADGRKDYVIDKNRINDVSSGSMVIEVKNAMPVQIGFILRLLNIQKQSLLQVPQSETELHVNAASVDAAGNVTVPAKSAVSFQLNENEVRQFNPAEYLTYAVSLATTPGTPAVRFKTSDYVQVRVWTSLTYRVNR